MKLTESAKSLFLTLSLKFMIILRKARIVQSKGE